MTKLRNFLVIWRPVDLADSTVNNLKAIDAFACSNKRMATTSMRKSLERGEYAAHGEGYVYLVEHASPALRSWRNPVKRAA